MERKISFSVDEYYHIFNRGNDKRNIFLGPRDYSRFLVLLYLCNSTKAVNIRDNFPKGVSFGEIMNFDRGETLVNIGAYCLMPNHFHLLIHEKKEDGLTKFMGKLSTGYSMYFNRKNKRTGKLFEGVFRAVHLAQDEHLRYLFAYIHLNPIKLIEPDWKEKGISNLEKFKKYLEGYNYSSYLDYTGKNKSESIILNKDCFPEYFKNFKEFNNFINEWLQFPKGESFGE